MMLKRIILITMAFVFVFSVVNIVAAADSTVNSSSDGLSTADKHIIVWEDDRDGSGSSHLYYKNLDTGVSSRVSWVNSKQSNPAISGSTVVWEDDRDGGTKVFYKNLETGVGSRLSWFNSKQTNPAISGSNVVWEDDRDGSQYYDDVLHIMVDNHKIYCKNLATGMGTRVSWADSRQTNPAISGTIVVWEDTRDKDYNTVVGLWKFHIYYKDLATGLGSRVSWTNSDQIQPAISGNTVVWADDRDGHNYRGWPLYRVYYKNLATKVGGKVSYFQQGEYSSSENPQISGNNVVWYYYFPYTNFIKWIFYKNLETGVGNRVSWVDSVQKTPMISGNTVVWSDSRDGGSKIYYKDIVTNAGGRPAWIDSNQQNPVIS